MNGIRIVTLKLLRTYATKPKPETAGIRGKLKLMELEGSEPDPESFEYDDMDEFESDFMNIGESHKLHEREVEKSRILLKQRITRSKYFKDPQPRFLTYVEKDQIKKLHESDPKEWTPEKLSESFPALPGTIKKILKSEWVPKSVDAIINYDKLAIKNWKNFKTGELVVDPALSEHLMKFKNRKISLTDRETLIEKFVPPKMEFPKPKSSMFSSIVKDNSVNSKPPMYSQKQISSKENLNRDEKRMATIDETGTGTSVAERYNVISKETNKQTKNKEEEKLTFDEFMKEKLKTLYETSPEEGITLLHTYRKQVESRTSEDISANVLNSTKKEAKVEEENVPMVKTPPKETALIPNTKQTQSKAPVEMNAESSSLDTHVKEWNSSVETKFDYVKNIKIPKNVYKQGMTYRIKDCYYDDDGAFLYRVPGVRG